MSAIVWVESHNCNNKCPYCHIYKLPQVKRGTWQEWVEKLNTLDITTIDITGGEPFLNNNLVDIIKGLKCYVGLTTNLTQDLTRFLDEVSPSKVVSITASYHPSQSSISRDDFLAKCWELRNKRFNVTINFVGYMEQVYMVEEVKLFFEREGFRFHIDPYHSGKDGINKLTDKDKEHLLKYMKSDRVFQADKVDLQSRNCSAGMNYICIHPNGDVYRCMTLSLTTDDRIGNIFEGFKLSNQLTRCDSFGGCGGCDQDKVTIRPL